MLQHLRIEMDTVPEGAERHYGRHGFKVIGQAATLSLSLGGPEIGNKGVPGTKLLQKGFSLWSLQSMLLISKLASYREKYAWLNVSVSSGGDHYLSPGYKTPPRCSSWSYLSSQFQAARQSAKKDFHATPSHPVLALKVLNQIFRTPHPTALPHRLLDTSLFPNKEESYFIVTLPAHFCFATGTHVD